MNLLCDLTSRLKNAIKANQKFVYFPKTSLTSSFSKILFLEGLVSSVVEIRSGKVLMLTLKYNSQGTSAIKGIKTFSTPSKMFNLSYLQLAKTNIGMGLFIISTNQGIFTSSMCMKRKLGGTLLCYLF